MKNLTITTSKGLLLTGLLILGSVAVAQETTIRLEHKAEQWERVTDENGVEQTRLVEATRVLPGAAVLFTVTYTNTGDEPAENVTVTNPVPDHMVYVDASASGDNASVTFSVDGGESFAAAQNLSVADANSVQRPAIAKDYTHVRWIVDNDVASGASGAVQFTAVVE